MPVAIIKKDSIDFLKSLSKNNNRDWFSKHKDRFTEAHNNIIEFADALLLLMNKHDHISYRSGKDSLFRTTGTYDLQKDKTPYNSHWSGNF